MLMLFFLRISGQAYKTAEYELDLIKKRCIIELRLVKRYDMIIINEKFLQPILNF